MSGSVRRQAWYFGGLGFECQGCGHCCSGPDEGYIWVTRREIELIADFLKISIGRLRHEYLKRVGFRTSILEEPTNKNCVFLEKTGEGAGCKIYEVRPSQCRSWPFWPNNLASTAAWNRAASKCAGVNRGSVHSFEEIEKIKKSKWWRHK